MVVSLAIFIITEILPGDVATMMLRQGATEQNLRKVREDLRLDRPAHVRYLDWIGGVVRGDLGESYVQKRPIIDVIPRRLGHSVILAVFGLVIGAITGAVAAGLAYFTVGIPAIGTALFLSMVVTMAAAGLMGAAVPLLLKAVRLDPALGAGVIVTTFTDVFAFFSFLGIGTLLLDRLTG